jgi:DNA-binding protein YbaB
VEQAEGLRPVDGAYDDLLGQARDFGRDANPEAALRQMQESMRALQEQLERVRTAEFSGTDPSGAVTAAVTGDGALRRVDIGARALRDLPGEALGAACVAAIQAARLGMAAGLQEHLTAMIGRSVPDPGLDPGPDPGPDPGLGSGLDPGLGSVSEAIRRGTADGARQWS